MNDEERVRTAPRPLQPPLRRGTVNVASSNGFYIGDTVTVEPGGAAQENVVLTAVGTNTLTVTHF